MGQCLDTPPKESNAIAAYYLPHKPKKAAKLMERNGDPLSACLLWLALGNLTEAKKAYRRGKATEIDILWYSHTAHSMHTKPYWDLLMACEIQDRRAIDLRVTALEESHGCPQWKQALLFNIKETDPWTFY